MARFSRSFSAVRRALALLSLQRSAGNRATAELASSLSASTVVQRFSEHEVDGLGAGFLSAGGKFFVLADGSKYYRRVDGAWVEQPRPEPKSFLPDCLHTTEEILNQQKLELGAGTQSRVLGGRVFGQSEKRNMEIAKQVLAKKGAINDNAAPGTGQAFVVFGITPLEDGELTYPYHAAAVVATDGDDRISFEAVASDSDAMEDDRSEGVGSFKIYGANQTFHDSWKGEWSEAVTFVIVAKAK